MRSSVRNTVSEIPIQSDPNSIDVRTIIRDIQDTVTENLNTRLLENGYVIFKVFIYVHVHIETSPFISASHKYLN